MYLQEKRPLEHSKFKWFRKTEKHFERVCIPLSGDQRWERGRNGRWRRWWGRPDGPGPIFDQLLRRLQTFLLRDASQMRPPHQSRRDHPSHVHQHHVRSHPSYWTTFYYDRIVPCIFLDTFLPIWVGLFSKSFPLTFVFFWHISTLQQHYCI